MKLLSRLLSALPALLLRGAWQGLLVLLVLLLAACQTVPRGLTVEVVQVLNGRELEVAGIPAQPDITERVQLIGLDAPALEQVPWGPAAKAYLTQRLQGQTVVLETDVAARNDRGQRLAYVWLGKELINETLVAEGYDLAVPQVPNERYRDRLAQAQDQARVLQRGIWNQEQPLRQTPAAWRQIHFPARSR